MYTIGGFVFQFWRLFLGAFQGGFNRQNCLQMEASCFSCDGAAAFMLVCCGSASGLRYQSGSASSVVVLHRNDWLVSAFQCVGVGSWLCRWFWLILCFFCRSQALHAIHRSPFVNFPVESFAYKKACISKYIYIYIYVYIFILCICMHYVIFLYTHVHLVCMWFGRNEMPWELSLQLWMQIHSGRPVAAKSVIWLEACVT